MIPDTNVLQQVLSSKTLTSLQLDHFGLSDDHLLVISRSLGTNTTLRHLQLLLARRQSHRQPYRQNQHVEQFSVAAVRDHLCATIATCNFTLESCVLWTAMDERQLRTATVTPTYSAEVIGLVEMRWQQEHLDMWCLLNKLGRQKLWHASPKSAAAATSSPVAPLWWKVIQKAAAIGRQQQRERSPLESALPVEQDDEIGATASSAANRCSLGAVYTLLRSNPALICNTAAGSVPAASSQLQQVTTTMEDFGCMAVVPPTLPPQDETVPTHHYSLRQRRRPVVPAGPKKCSGSSRKRPAAAV